MPTLKKFLCLFLHKFLSMIKKIFGFLLCFSLAFAFSGCKKPPENNAKTDYIAFEAEEMLNNMTIEEKIAQMIITEVKNDGILPSPAPAGVILFGENFTTGEDAKALINSLKAQSETPLIISTDQEGGRVQRLASLKNPKATNIPYMYDLGSQNDLSLAKDVGRVMATEMAALGVNLTFAPCLDVYSNPLNTVIGKRSFSENPSTVSAVSSALAEGLTEKGVQPCFKHFPGHGDTATDSHIALPIINKTKDELYKTELIPFEAAIENGAEMIMVGHIALPQITGDNTPSSLSKTVITDLLKNEMGYTGIVITDSFRMKGLTDNYSEEEAVKLSIEAGADIILMPQSFDNCMRIIKENFSEERINESVRKILYYKQKNLSELPKYDLSVIGCREHQITINKINR